MNIGSFGVPDKVVGTMSHTSREVDTKPTGSSMANTESFFGQAIRNFLWLPGKELEYRSEARRAEAKKLCAV